MLLWHYIAGLALFITLVNAQGKKAGNVCINQKNCGACIEAGSGCGWCTQTGYDADNKERCDFVKNLVHSGCDDTFIVRPEHEVEYTRNDPPQNSIPNREDAIQLSPQEIDVTLRPNSPFKFNVNFRQAENYPVDLYYVMDLSNSMEDDKEKLAELGDLLADEMSQITENFKLGFGSFVDKKTMPYVSTVPEKLAKPCDTKDGKPCAAPYGFHNQLSLTAETKLFKSKVNEAPISGNLDHPEGGFDAIMQAVACQEEIGWRDSSRKILMYSTDALFHWAGDGMLGGIVKPNDGHCHMENNYYSESLNQDYPSVSQVSHKIAEKKVNVIFAVTDTQLDVYKKLSKHIEGSAVGMLADDSSNIVTLVRENYEKISGTVELKTEGAEGIFVTFRTMCLGDSIRESGACEGIRVGDNITYEVAVEVRECPKDKADWKKTFDIYPVGLTEKLTVNLEYICECECEAVQVEAQKSKKERQEKCNGNGTFECGACSCDPGMYGKKCECDGSSLESEDYNAACRMTNTSEICDGQGQCLCGTCDCYPITPGGDHKWSGKFCECDDYSCDYYDNKVCGGPERGKCVCGYCACNPEYTGKSCDCPISQETCRASEESGGLICNGKGTCVCGVCSCNTETYYRGPTCEDCPSCPGKCEQNKACVLCEAFKSGELSKEYCDANCTHVDVVPSVEDEPGWKLCKFRDEDDGCYYYFVYEYSSDVVKAQETKECPTPVNVLAIVLGIIAAIILIGLLLLLIWKIIITIHDRREYAKFMTEEKKRKWEVGENPIYKQATSNYANPMYTKK